MHDKHVKYATKRQSPFEEDDECGDKDGWGRNGSKWIGRVIKDVTTEPEREIEP